MMNEYGRQVEWTGGQTLYQVQQSVGHQIENELVERLLQSENLSEEWRRRLAEDHSQLPIFIRDKIEENY